MKHYLNRFRPFLRHKNGSFMSILQNITVRNAGTMSVIFRIVKSAVLTSENQFGRVRRSTERSRTARGPLGTVFMKLINIF